MWRRYPYVRFDEAKKLVSEKYNRNIENPYDLEPEEEELISKYFKDSDVTSYSLHIIHQRRDLSTQWMILQIQNTHPALTFYSEVLRLQQVVSVFMTMKNGEAEDGRQKDDRGRYGAIHVNL